MQSYEDIEKRITDLGFIANNLPSTELKSLPKLLQENESLEGIASGLYTNRNGILVATNKRVIFFYKGRLWGEHVEYFPYDKITSIEYETGIIGGSITVIVAGKTAKIEMVPVIYCKVFAETVRRLISNKSELINLKSPDDLLSKLERLAALKNAGMLTETEFSLAKEKLLKE